MKVLNVGFVGTGEVTNIHFEIMKQIPDVCFRSVCGRDTERLGQKQNEWGVNTYTSITEMVTAENLDIVLIANENFNHAMDARLAIEAGAHVLVEKPLDASLHLAKELVDFSNSKKKILGVVMQKRFDSNVLKIKKFIENSALGEIGLARVDVFMNRSEDYFNSKTWIQDPSKVGGGILLHHAIHSIDVLLWVMISKVILISGWTSNQARSMKIEDCGGCWIRFENGATASIMASVSLHESLKNRLEIFGTLSSIYLEGTSLRLHPAIGSSAKSDEPHPIISDGDDHKCLWIDYIDAVRNNRLPIACGASALKTQIVIDALYRSASNSRTINMK